MSWASSLKMLRSIPASSNQSVQVKHPLGRSDQGRKNLWMKRPGGKRRLAEEMVWGETTRDFRRQDSNMFYLLQSQCKANT